MKHRDVFCRLAVAIFSVAAAFSATPTEALAQSGAPPKPVVALTPGTSIYKASLEIDGRIVPLDLARTVKLVKGAWVITEVTTMSSYIAIDSTFLDKKSLVPLRRVMRDPTMSLELRFIGNMASGTITTRGQTRPIYVDMHGALYADGPGAQDAIAALPLARGYNAEFLNFDTETQEVSELQLRVLGSEVVSVPAGRFNTWKVLTTSATGGPGQTAAYWIDKKTRRVVKFATTLLEQNEVVATAELTK
jgi:hypothetical protein